MSVEPSVNEFAIINDDFNALRVEYIEAFVRMEAQLATILIAHKSGADPTQPFAAKLTALNKLSGHGLSKKAVECFAKLKDETATFVRIRNDLVHGLMSRVTHDGQVKAAFRNATDIATNMPQFTIISAEEMKEGRKQIRRLTNQLKQLANPPSPPQPSPVATSDP